MVELGGRGASRTAIFLLEHPARFIASFNPSRETPNGEKEQQWRIWQNDSRISSRRCGGCGRLVLLPQVWSFACRGCGWSASLLEAGRPAADERAHRARDEDGSLWHQRGCLRVGRSCLCHAVRKLPWDAGS